MVLAGLTNAVSCFDSDNAFDALQQLMLQRATSDAALVALGVCQWRDDGTCLLRPPVSVIKDDYDKRFNALRELYLQFCTIKNPKEFQKQLEAGRFLGPDQFELWTDGKADSVEIISRDKRIMGRFNPHNRCNDGHDPQQYGGGVGDAERDEDAAAGGGREVTETKEDAAAAGEEDESTIPGNDDEEKPKKSSGTAKRKPSSTGKTGKGSSGGVKKKKTSDGKYKASKPTVTAVGIHHKGCSHRAQPHTPFACKLSFIYLLNPSLFSHLPCVLHLPRPIVSAFAFGM